MSDVPSILRRGRRNVNTYIPRKFNFAPLIPPRDTALANSGRLPLEDAVQFVNQSTTRLANSHERTNLQSLKALMAFLHHDGWLYNSHDVLSNLWFGRLIVNFESPSKIILFVLGARASLIHEIEASHPTLFLVLVNCVTLKVFTPCLVVLHELWALGYILYVQPLDWHMGMVRDGFA